jgi:hypothetical protein
VGRSRHHGEIVVVDLVITVEIVERIVVSVATSLSG